MWEEVLRFQSESDFSHRLGMAYRSVCPVTSHHRDLPVLTQKYRRNVLIGAGRLRVPDYSATGKLPTVEWR